MKVSITGYGVNPTPINLHLRRFFLIKITNRLISPVFFFPGRLISPGYILTLLTYALYGLAFLVSPLNVLSTLRRQLEAR